MKRWIAISMKMDHILPGELVPRPHLVTRIQRLGELDCHLVDDEENVDVLKLEKPEHIGLFSERLYLSHLWALDAYEIIRILKERDDKYHDLYKAIKTIRIPLAKHQKANDKDKAFGYEIYPILDPSTGRVGWATQDQDIFVRSDFALEMIETFEAELWGGSLV